ncbi:MAG TPA: hypothetical protein VGB53_15220 [Rubricoccaceae bacterium]|jgi:hypothetical protein
MNQRQANTHRMHREVLELLDRRPDLWTGDEAAEPAVVAFREAVAEVADIDRERNALGTTGMTKDKAAARDAMEALALRLARATRAYARATKNGALFDAVNVLPSGFDRATETDAAGMAERVAGAAEEHLGALAKYRVTKQSVEEVRAAIAAFGKAAPAVGATGGQREARTRSMRAAFVAADEAVDGLDDVVEGVIDDSEFAAEYRRVRRTDDR